MDDGERIAILEELDEIEASLKAIRKVVGGSGAQQDDVDDMFATANEELLRD